MGFAAEADAAIAAGARLNMDPRAIVKHGDHRDSWSSSHPGNGTGGLCE
jgi:hypothetical protein